MMTVVIAHLMIVLQESKISQSDYQKTFLLVVFNKNKQMKGYLA